MNLWCVRASVCAAVVGLAYVCLLLTTLHVHVRGNVNFNCN